MKDLLLKRKKSFLKYVVATGMFIVDHFLQMLVFALILGAIEKKDMEYYRMTIVIVIVFVLYKGVNFYLSRLLRIGYMRDTVLDVRRQAFDKIIHMSFKQYSKKSREVYLSNLINDINTFENKFFINLLNLMIDSGMFVISLVMLFFFDVKLAFIMCGCAAIIYFFGSMFSKRTLQLQQELSTENEVFTTDLSNTLNGVEILKLNDIEDKFLAKTIHKMNMVEKKKLSFNFFTQLQTNVIYNLNGVISVIVMIYLAYMMINGASLTMCTLIFQLCMMLGYNLTASFPLYNVVKSSAKLYEKITKSDTTIETSIGTEKFVFQDKIIVNDVSFSYDQRKILDHVNFEIEKGKKYLIKGISGAGKSTLMNLLAKIYDDYEGTIQVDGVEYRSISEKNFNEKVSFIYQDVFLFEDTIKNNIALYKEISDEDIERAVHICGLDSLIAKKKDGLNEMLKENGKNLSGGQRQRISIARAIAKDADILFVDEGTSSLNESLGREIEQAFLELNRTVISISHRYYEGVTENYDYVIELKNGHIHTFSGTDYFKEVITC